MQVVSKTRRLSRVFKSPILIFSERFIAPDAPLVEAPHTCLQWRKLSTFSSQRAFLSGNLSIAHVLVFGLESRNLSFPSFSIIQFIKSETCNLYGCREISGKPKLNME